MMKRSFYLALVAVAFLLTTGCCKRGERTAQLEEYGTFGSALGSNAASGYVSGSWGEKFVRSNGYTYPFVFDEPISQCAGFTLDYQIHEVAEGNLNGNYRYEVYVHQTSGKWKSVKLFKMEGNASSVAIQFDNLLDIDAVAVVCGKKGEVSFSYTIGICKVRYA